MSQLELFSTPNNKSKPQKTGQKSLFDDLPDTPKTRQTSEHSSVDKTADKSDMETPQDLNHPSVEALANEIHRHNVLYNGGKTEISDAQFDALTQKLRNLEPNHPVLSELTTPEVHSNGKVVHETPMLSLEKAEKGKEMEQIANWLKSFTGDFIATPKIDGLACSLRYDEQGRLKVAATRGNGTVGENITKNALYIQGVPHQIAQPGLEIRGEVYMPLTAFQAFDGEKRSARNLAVGGLKQKDATETARYGLCFFAYDVLNLHMLGNDAPKTESQKYELLQNLGFTTVDVTPFTRTNAENSENKTASMILAEIQAYCDNMELHRSEWNFDADGLVFKVDDIEQQEELGKTDHHPKCAIAYKFKCETGKTILRSVEWQLAKGSTITPVAQFDPVLLAGAMVQRATLSNVGQIRAFKTQKPELSDAEFHDESRAEADKFDFKHLHIGAELLISRRGDVIPHIEYVISTPENAQKVTIPPKCPSCGASVVDDDVFLRCTDPDNCPSTGQALIENYAKVTGIMGLGEKIIESLYDAGLIRTPADLYRLDVPQIASVLSLTDAGQYDEKAILPEKLYDSIQNARNLTLADFLTALSIPALGKVTSRSLADYYQTLDNLRKSSKKDLTNSLCKAEQKNDHKIVNTIFQGLEVRRNELRKLLEEKIMLNIEHTNNIKIESSKNLIAQQKDVNELEITKFLQGIKKNLDVEIPSLGFGDIKLQSISNTMSLFDFFKSSEIDIINALNKEWIDSDGKTHKPATIVQASQIASALITQLSKFKNSIIPWLNEETACSLEKFDSETQSDLMGLSEILQCLTIPGLGNVRRTELVKHFKTLEQLSHSTVNELSEVLFPKKEKEGRAASIYRGIQNRRNLIDDLLQFVEIASAVQEADAPFSGKSFLFTGSLQSMKREEAEARVKALGGMIAGSVKKDLSVLVATSKTTTKWKKAEELNKKASKIQLLTEDEFLKLLEEAESSNPTES